MGEECIREVGGPKTNFAFFAILPRGPGGGNRLCATGKSCRCLAYCINGSRAITELKHWSHYIKFVYVNQCNSYTCNWGLISLDFSDKASWAKEKSIGLRLRRPGFPSPSCTSNCNLG